MARIYGIKNCDTVRKARRWLDAEQIPYHFVDFREDGLTSGQVKHWLDAIGAERLVNRRSTSWKQLSEEQRDLSDTTALIELLVDTPTLIKRPVLETDDRIEVGFSADTWKTLLKTQDNA